MTGGASSVALPGFDRAALLLDLDGTLLDIAPTPDAVVVEPGLLDSLRGLVARLEGALAVVTGRPIDVVDRLLEGVPHAVAGEHGAVFRHAPRAPIERPALPSPPQSWIDQATDLVSRHPGTLLEPKARGFALHFRQAPEAGPALHRLMASLVADQAAFQLLEGTMTWEIRPVGADKGRAVDVVMRHDPFAGRTPIFIGDDVTDEDGMRVARTMGGLGLRVDRFFGTPHGVRLWLAAAARAEGWPPLPGDDP